MNWLKTAFSSSIGKKVLMAISGLLLCGFLFFHLAGNFLLFVGADAYNGYAHTLHSQEAIIMLAETGLVALFALHIFMALSTDRDNREARPKENVVRRSNILERFLPAEFSPENWMFFSGIIVLVFLLIHISDFTLGLSFAKETAGKEPFDKAIIILRNPLRMFVYIVGPLVLGWHLLHGVRSALQTLGLNHPKYNGLFVWGGRLFSAFVGIGFSSFAMWAMMIDHDPNIAKPEEATPDKTHPAKTHTQRLEETEEVLFGKVSFEELQPASRISFVNTRGKFFREDSSDQDYSS